MRNAHQCVAFLFMLLKVYIETLVKKGYKVAICEQLEDPKAVKGIVKRDVIKVITPGTVMTEMVMMHGQTIFYRYFIW